MIRVNCHEYQVGIKDAERGTVDDERERDISDYAEGVREGQACAWLKALGVRGIPLGIGAEAEHATKLGWDG